MALKPKLTADEHGKLDKIVQSEYVERDGFFFLDVTPMEGLELADVGKLKKTVETTRKERDDIKAQLKPFEGIDPAAARDALAKVGEMDNWDPDEKLKQHKATFEKQLSEKYVGEQKQLTEKHAKEISERDARDKARLSQLEEALITSAASQAIAVEKGSVELLLPVIKTRTRLREGDGGKLITEVLNDDGSVRLGPGAGNTNPMTISEYVSELKKSSVYSRAFDGDGTSGSGANGSNGRPRGTFTITNQEAKDPLTYRAAKEAAQKAGKPFELQG